MSVKIFNVYLDGRKIAKCLYDETDDASPESVKQELVECGDYPAEIRVTRQKRK